MSANLNASFDSVDTAIAGGIKIRTASKAC